MKAAAKSVKKKTKRKEDDEVSNYKCIVHFYYTHTYLSFLTFYGQLFYCATKCDT